MVLLVGVAIVALCVIVTKCQQKKEYRIEENEGLGFGNAIYQGSIYIHYNGDMAHVCSIASLGGEYAGKGPRLSACDCKDLLEVCSYCTEDFVIMPCPLFLSITHQCTKTQQTDKYGQSILFLEL